LGYRWREERRAMGEGEWKAALELLIKEYNLDPHRLKVSEVQT